MDRLITLIESQSPKDAVQQNFLGMYNNLDEDVREIIEAQNVREVLEQHEEFQPLQEHQKTIIENNVYMALLGLVELMDFTTMIKHESEIARDRAEKIAGIIEREFFDPNITLLEEMFETVEESSQATVPSVSGVVNEEPHNPPPTPEQVTPIPPTPPETPTDQPQEEKPDSLDIFKKRLETPVHTATEEQVVEEAPIEVDQTKRGEANQNPSSHEQIARDPYKETID